MTITCRAAIMFGKDEPLRVETIEVAEPGPHEVLIKVSAAGLCHSDLSVIEGKFPSNPPVVLGHEAIGNVVRVGEGVTVAAEGDVVMPFLVPDCGKCVYCLSGRTNRCIESPKVAVPPKSWFSHKGKPVGSMVNIGAFAEYIVVPEIQVQKVNPAAPVDKACSIGCGVTTGLGAALITANIVAGSSVVAIGMGGVGLSVVQGARIAGAKMIIGVDRNPDKEKDARRFGATHFLNAESDVVAEVKKLTTIGADYAFDCVGVGSVFKTALHCLSQGNWAKLVSVGVNADKEPIPMVWSDLTGRQWQRSYMGSAKRQDMAKFVDWLVDGKIDLDGMVSHRVTLDDINDGFDLMREGKTNRVVIEHGRG